MFLGLIAAFTAKAATELFISGAAASIALLTVGTKVKKRK